MPLSPAATHSAGAPPAGPTFFCDPSSALCFNYTSTAATWAAAQTLCAAQAGRLMVPSSAGKQLLVERYFANSSVLSTTVYWLGISRRDENSSYVFVDGCTFPQNVSNSPYAHWAWQYPNKRLYPYHCGLARATSTYDFFVGDISTMGDPDYYVTSSSNTDRK